MKLGFGPEGFSKLSEVARLQSELQRLRVGGEAPVEVLNGITASGKRRRFLGPGGEHRKISKKGRGLGLLGSRVRGGGRLFWRGPGTYSRRSKRLKIRTPGSPGHREWTSQVLVPAPAYRGGNPVSRLTGFKGPVNLYESRPSRQQPISAAWASYRQSGWLTKAPSLSVSQGIGHQATAMALPRQRARLSHLLGQARRVQPLITSVDQGLVLGQLLVHGVLGSTMNPKRAYVRAAPQAPGSLWRSSHRVPKHASRLVATSPSLTSLVEGRKVSRESLAQEARVILERKNKN